MFNKVAAMPWTVSISTGPPMGGPTVLEIESVFGPARFYNKVSRLAWAINAKVAKVNKRVVEVLVVAAHLKTLNGTQPSFPAHRASAKSSSTSRYTTSIWSPAATVKNPSVSAV